MARIIKNVKPEIYVLHYNGQPLHMADTVDWKPPKKVYFTPGAAKSGITALRAYKSSLDVDKIEIVKYVPER